MTAKTPTTQPTAPLVKAKKPSARLDKGEPPQSAADTVVVGNNTKQSGGSKPKDIGFKVTEDYKHNFDLFCATHKLSGVGAFKMAMAEFMRKKGWEPTEG